MDNNDEVVGRINLDEVSVDDRRRLVVTCLRGQPFGFTWKDVRDLHDVADNDYDMPGWLHGLADRIEALLPPETT